MSLHQNETENIYILYVLTIFYKNVLKLKYVETAIAKQN
jgi:hypothetical protein